MCAGLVGIEEGARLATRSIGRWTSIKTCIQNPNFQPSHSHGNRLSSPSRTVCVWRGERLVPLGYTCGISDTISWLRHPIIPTIRPPPGLRVQASEFSMVKGVLFILASIFEPVICRFRFLNQLPIVLLKLCTKPLLQPKLCGDFYCWSHACCFLSGRI